MHCTKRVIPIWRSPRDMCAASIAVYKVRADARWLYPSCEGLSLIDTNLHVDTTSVSHDLTVAPFFLGSPYWAPSGVHVSEEVR